MPRGHCKELDKVGVRLEYSSRKSPRWFVHQTVASETTEVAVGLSNTHKLVHDSFSSVCWGDTEDKL
jgi:formylmethanofuran dehydrogenase subunit B